MVSGIDLQAVYPHIDRNSLFKMSWQFRGVHDPERWAELVRTELEPRLERSMARGRSGRVGWTCRRCTGTGRPSPRATAW